MHRGSWSLVTATLLALAALPAGARAQDLEPRPAEFPAVHRQSDVAIEMRDGVRLYADIVRPAGEDGAPAPGRFPVILTQTPYNRALLAHARGDLATLAGPDPMIVRRGYVSVVVDVRGTGSSQGAWDSFGEEEQRDGPDIAGWIHDQPWSSGELALYGASYMAINQFLTAARGLDGLEAMFPIIPAADVYRDVVWHGGAVDAGFIPLWIGLVTALKLPPPTYTGSQPDEALVTMLERITGGFRFPLEAALGVATANDLAYDGPFYRLRSPIEVVDRIDVPTFVVGGWFDLFQRGVPKLYEGLDLEPGRKQLLVGPWYHITTGEGLGGPGAPPPLSQLALAWFDRWVKGIGNGVEDFGPLTLYELGSERWTTHRQWPDRTARWDRLYLHGDGALAPGPPADVSEQTVPPNKLAGVCTRSTAQWTGGALVPGQYCEEDNRLNEATALTYTSAPVTEPTRIAGSVSLTLRGSTTGADTTWVATLTDVHPDGRSEQITAGWLMPSRRALDLDRSERAGNGDLAVPFHPFTRDSLLPVEPGVPDDLAIEIFPTDLVLEPGHRLRLVITSADVPHMLAPGLEAAETQAQIDRVHLDPAHPSFLTLPSQDAGPAARPRRLLPARKRCLERRRHTVRIRRPARGVAIRWARASLNGRRTEVRRRRGRWRAVVRLRPSRRNRVKLEVTVRGSDGRTYRDTRRYRVCGRKPARRGR